MCRLLHCINSLLRQSSNNDVKINLKVKIAYINHNSLKFTWEAIQVFHFFFSLTVDTVITFYYCYLLRVCCSLHVNAILLGGTALICRFSMQLPFQCGACGSWSVLLPSQVLYTFISCCWSTVHAVRSTECRRFIEVIKKIAVTEFLSKLRWLPKLVGLHQSRITIITVLDGETQIFKIALKVIKETKLQGSDMSSRHLFILIFIKKTSSAFMYFVYAYYKTCLPTCMQCNRQTCEN
jgi:hypothetical protein